MGVKLFRNNRTGQMTPCNATNQAHCTVHGHYIKKTKAIVRPPAELNPHHSPSKAEAISQELFYERFQDSPERLNRDYHVEDLAFVEKFVDEQSNDLLPKLKDPVSRIHIMRETAVQALSNVFPHFNVSGMYFSISAASWKSKTGFQSEAVLRELINEDLKNGNSVDGLEAYYSGNEIKKEVSAMKERLKKRKKSERPTRAQIAEFVSEVSAKTLISENYIHSMIMKPKKDISFPDSIAVFKNPLTGEREVRFAEQKLSGENDNKSVEINVEKLVDVPAVDGVKVRRAVVLTGVDLQDEGNAAVAQRWIKEGSVRSVETFVNNDAYSFLGGRRLSRSDYAKQVIGTVTWSSINLQVEELKKVAHMWAGDTNLYMNLRTGKMSRCNAANPATCSTHAHGASGVQGVIAVKDTFSDTDIKRINSEANGTIARQIKAWEKLHSANVSETVVNTVVEEFKNVDPNIKLPVSRIHLDREIMVRRFLSMNPDIRYNEDYFALTSASWRSKTGYHMEAMLDKLINRQIERGEVDSGLEKYYSGSTIKDEVMAIRNRIKSSNVADRPSRAEINAFVTATSEKTMISEKYISDMLKRNPRFISFPDSIAIIRDPKTGEREVRFAEQKVSGENDSKSVVQNIKKLAKVPARDGVKVRKAVILTGVDLRTQENSLVGRRWYYKGQLSNVEAHMNHHAFDFLGGKVDGREGYEKLVIAPMVRAGAELQLRELRKLSENI